MSQRIRRLSESERNVGHRRRREMSQRRRRSGDRDCDTIV